MKNDIDKACRELEMKVLFLRLLPAPRTVYASPLDYGRHEVFAFDEDKFSVDPAYRDYILKRYHEHNEDSEFFNKLIDRAADSALW